MIGDASQRLAGKRRKRCNAEESEVGFAGRAEQMVGGASRRLAGRQRRRNPTVEESEVEFKGQAERPSKTQVGDGAGKQSRRCNSRGRTFGPSGRVGRLIGGASRRLAGRQRRRDWRTTRVGG